MRDDLPCPRQYTTRLSINRPVPSAVDFKDLANECEDTIDPNQRSELADALGVSPGVLARLHVGWSDQHRAYTFPMRSADGATIGIQLRRTDGSKRMVPGSRLGLFMPRDFWGPIFERLIICEGASDTAAMMMLDFVAVGRASCESGAELLIDFVVSHRIASVAIIADSDEPGVQGARNLASRLIGHLRDGVRIVIPKAKDVREWVRNGATYRDVLDAIKKADDLKLHYSLKALSR